MLDRSRKTDDMTEEEILEITSIQIEKVRRTTENFQALLKKREISTVTPEIVVELTDEFDPLLGHGCIQLYRWPNFSTAHSNAQLSLPSGVYPSLGIFRFNYSWLYPWGEDSWNNRTTSYINPDGAFIMFKSFCESRVKMLSLISTNESGQISVIGLPRNLARQSCS